MLPAATTSAVCAHGFARYEPVEAPLGVLSTGRAESEKGAHDGVPTLIKREIDNSDTHACITYILLLYFTERSEMIPIYYVSLVERGG